jgi:hypothetical protein
VGKPKQNPPADDGGCFVPAAPLGGHHRILHWVPRQAAAAKTTERINRIVEG